LIPRRSATAPVAHPVLGQPVRGAPQPEDWNMMRKRGIRRPNRHVRRLASGQASTYIRPIDAIGPGDSVVLWCRVSSGPQDANGNNADQEAELRAAVRARGGTVVDVRTYAGTAGSADAQLYRAANAASRANAVLLAESTSRFARHPEYHPKRRPHLRAGFTQLHDLRWVCGDVTLVTLHDPDISWREERALQSRRGQQQKGNKGGRPTKREHGYKKRLRRLMLSKVFWLSKTGLSVRRIATILGHHPNQIQRWRDRLRGR